MVKRLSAHRAQRLLRDDDPIVVDLRDPAAHRKAHLPKAVRLTPAKVPNLLMRERRDRPILIYCHRGEQSPNYGAFFEDLGFRYVYSVKGGFEAWRQAECELEMPPSVKAEVRCDPLTTWLMAVGGDPEDINRCLPDGRTPLTRACHEGLAEVVEALLAAGADPSLTDQHGNDPIHEACQQNELAALTVLLDFLHLSTQSKTRNE